MWREVVNKAYVYGLVRVAAVSLRLDLRAPWSELVAAVHRRAAYPRLFHLERLGHDLALAAWRAEGPPRGLLCGERAAGLPPRSLVPLHLGMGMAFARRLLRPLRPLRPGTADREVDAALATFVALCDANAQPGLVEAALEPLGVVVGLFHSRLTARIEARLRALDPRLCAYFWHGAGRAVYFAPSHFHPFPWAIRRAVERCRRAPAGAENRSDALAGLFFAAAMVNLRQPDVLAALLREAALTPEEIDACRIGILTCVLTRHDAIPDDPAIPSLLAHRPADPPARKLWESCVTAPCTEGLAHVYPLLRLHGQLGLLARYRPLAEIYRLLEADVPARIAAGGAR